jgi:hypothetical protein
MDLSKMTGSEIRKMMIEKGWHSQDQYSTFGYLTGWGYRIWFEIWNWHGVFWGNKVIFHSGTNNPDEIENCIRTAAKKALDAWEKYNDSIPYQCADGSTAKDGLFTPLFLDASRTHDNVSAPK